MVCRSESAQKSQRGERRGVSDSGSWWLDIFVAFQLTLRGFKWEIQVVTCYLPLTGRLGLGQNRFFLAPLSDLAARFQGRQPSAPTLWCQRAANACSWCPSCP